MDKGLITQLLKTPSQIRAEEQEALRQKGLQRAALVRGSGGAGASLFGGMFRDFAAQQAAQVDTRTDQLKRGLMGAVGMDSRSAAEQQAVQQQEQARLIQGADNLTRLKAVKKRLEDQNASPVLMAQINQRIEAEEAAVSARAKAKFDQAQAEATAARADESLALQRETLQVRKDELAKQGVKPTEIEDVVRVIDGKEVTGTLLINPVTKEEQFFQTKDTSKDGAGVGGVQGELASRLHKVNADLTAARESGADLSVIDDLESQSRTLQASMNIGDKIMPVLTKSIEAGTKATTMAARADEVIEYINKNEATYTSGAEETFRAGLTSALGTQGDRDVINTVISQVRIAEVIQNLPPGVASDKDVALVLEGALDPNASASAMRDYMRGIKKIAQAKAAREAAFAEYLDDPVNLKDPAGFPSFYKAKQEKARMQDLIDNWGVDAKQAKALSKDSEAYGEFILRENEKAEAKKDETTKSFEEREKALGIN